MIHSKKLEETMLWQIYLEKANLSGKRCDWVKDVYEAAAEYLADIRLTFQNYTLHDGTHILNVLDAMGGLLGDQIRQLSLGESELLILAACMHDLGMVYTDEERQQWYEDEREYREFLRDYCPELLGRPAKDWPEDIRKWYLRTLHPFRIPEVLQNEAWKELFDRCPLDVVPKYCMIAVCQAHGENWSELCSNQELDYLPVSDADPLFCVLLLRLADLLDFDDTRAPKILYGYVKENEKSRTEWDKHRASAGFRYPASPSASDLPYKAQCTNPGIEHAVRDFLDWIDEELANCVKLQRYCKAGWRQEFPFPRAVLRNEIESDGYMSGDFCLTMDQAQILNLLTGENLYDHTDVFIRELLQNAIDATLLRGEMDRDFIPEESRIDLWEWNDAKGNIWFRIDDEGTGMTLGMLQRYFLKVGNSYYNSQELERDMRDHGRTEKYHGISRFGIGFLSSFLCGEYVEVSTLYFDPEKNRREEDTGKSQRMVQYGLRLQITGLTGYYTLKNQSEHHPTDGELPTPADYDIGVKNGLERRGYRAKSGTSIVIRLNPGKLGAMDLRATVEKYLFGARMPIYYNNKRIGQTYAEVMQEAHEMAGKRIYELSPELKKKFDQNFPAIQGQYPKIVITVIPLDTEEDQVLPDFSGVLIKYDIDYDKSAQWKVKDQEYHIYTNIQIKGKTWEIQLESENSLCPSNRTDAWKEIKREYGIEKVNALEKEFEKHSACPKMQDIMEIWQPFAKNNKLVDIWRLYNNDQQKAEMRFYAIECGCPDIALLSLWRQYESIKCIYQGIIAGDIEANTFFEGGIFLLENMWKPFVEISRSKISDLPLTVFIAIAGILVKYQILRSLRESLGEFEEWKTSTLKQWREARNFRLGEWMRKNLKDYFIINMLLLGKATQNPDISEFTINPYLNTVDTIMFKYLIANLQDVYEMTICYEDGQIISFYEKKDNSLEDSYDLFPPMMFCKASSRRSRQYICCANSVIRRGITLDHPFIEWLLDNSFKLKQYYERQFQRIVTSLCAGDADAIIKECNRIREQMISLPEHHGVDVNAMPRLSEDDFWSWEEWFDHSERL